MVEKMEEIGKQRDMSVMRRSRTGDLGVVGNGLMWVASDATWNHGGVLACVATRGSDWVHGFAATGICYHQRLDGHPGKGGYPGTF